MADDARIKCFADCQVWRKMHAFVLDIYRNSRQFPKDETYGLTSQMRRAAVSIPSNFVEGFRRKSLTEKKRFYNIAQGSISECHYQLLLANDLGYCDSNGLISQLKEIDLMLDAWIRAIEKEK